MKWGFMGLMFYFQQNNQERPEKMEEGDSQAPRGGPGGFRGRGGFRGGFRGGDDRGPRSMDVSFFIALYHVIERCTLPMDKARLFITLE